MTTCNRCKKPLTDPVSIERGIGPECWASKITEGRKEQTGNLFSNCAEFTWGIDGQVLWLKDSNTSGGKSLTNDMENALAKVQAELDTPINAYLIMYRDSEGIWDRVVLIEFNLKQVLADAAFLNKGGYYNARGLDVGFKYLGTKSYTEAKAKLVEAAHT
jgi:hypothetical protein